MRYLIGSILALTTLAGCQTTKIVEVDRPVPIYLTIQPERPNLNLEELNWLYLPEQELFALDSDQYDHNNENWAKTEAYIKQLQESIIYYEQATSKPN